MPEVPYAYIEAGGFLLACIAVGAVLGALVTALRRDPSCPHR